MGEEKICAVCGDRATGYHFHVMTCEGCKGFFRRSISKGVCFTCPFTRNCTVTKAKRRQCQACRLQKCLAVGMRKDMIMSEEALQMRRVLRKRKQQEREPAGEPAELTEEQEQIISILLEAHKRHFDSGFSQFAHCRGGPLAPLQSLPGDMLPDIFSMLPHFADLSTVLIQQVIKFAKEIPAFRSLPIDDQISLLKGATLEICQIQFNTVFNEETKAWECGQHCYTIQDGALDHPGITQRHTIDQLQEKMALTLKSYIDQCSFCPRLLYAKLLLLLTELRTLKVENTRQILHIQDLTAMTPLLSEIIS
uniref:Nuclear receptor subfamily 1 group I member 3 n=1 Tax=Chelonoidis abingdonii TaxID=106734 RepID=A0A8C0JA44_CHEAB